MIKNERLIIKSESRSNINLGLLSTCLLLFTFIISINPDILMKSLFLSIQLSLSIPFFMGAIFARTKLAYAKNPQIWDKLGFIEFILGYGFLVNAIGIMMELLLTPLIGILYFIVNILGALIYSAMDIKSEGRNMKDRIYKDLFFILILIFLGILPALKIY